MESEQFFRPKAGGYHTAKLPIPKTVAYSCRYLRFKEYEIYEWSKAATQCYITQAALTTSKGRQQQPNKEALARKLTSVQFLQVCGCARGRQRTRSEYLCQWCAMPHADRGSDISVGSTELLLLSFAVPLSLQLRGKLGLKNAQLVEELHYPKTRLFVQAKIPFMIANNAGLPGLADFEAAAAPTPAEVPAAAPGLLPDAQAPPAPPAPAAAAVGQPPAQAAAGPAAQAHPPLLAAAPVPAAEGAEGEAEMPAASAPAATEAPAAAAAAAIAVVAAPAQAAAAAAVTDTAVAAVDAAAALLLARIPAAPQSSRLKRCLHVEAAGAPDGSPKAPRVGSSHCSQLQPAAASEAHPAAAGQHGACR